MSAHATSRTRSGLRHNVLGSTDAVAQSLALLALAFGVAAAPGGVAADAGLATPWAYVIAGVGSLCLASVIVRFTRRIAHVGGLYAYTVRGLGPQVGFIGGWLYAIAYAVGISFVLIIASQFLTTVLDRNTSVHLSWFTWYVILIAILWLLALGDIRVSTRVQLVFAVIGVGAVLALCIGILAHGGANGVTARPLDPSQSPSVHALFLGGVLAFTGFIGFEAAAVLGEEAAHPLRVIPRAILGTVIVATVYYVFVTWSMAVGFGPHHVGEWISTTALATLADRYVAHWFGTFLDSVVVVDAFVAALAGLQLTSRTMFAMGRDRGIPSIFSMTTPRFKSPFVGITLGVVLTLVLGVTLGRHYGVFTYFAMMATTGSLGILFVYVLVALSGMVYFWRLRTRGAHSYNVLFDLVLPLGAVAICGYTIYCSITPAPPAPISYSVWIALGWLVAGLVVVGVLLVIRPEAVKGFGRAFGGAHDEGGPTAPDPSAPPQVAEVRT